MTVPFREFPLMLYSATGGQRVVGSPQEEIEAGEGWSRDPDAVGFARDGAALPGVGVKPARPVPAAVVAPGGSTMPVPPSAQAQPLVPAPVDDRDALKARAVALGIEVDRRWTTPRLAGHVARAEAGRAA